MYEAAIPVLRFPLAVGDAWTVTAEVRDGTLLGVGSWSQDETYTVEVAAAGEIRLPDVTFTRVLKVSTHLIITPLAVGQPIQTRQISFLFECFGEVARATSAPFHDETDPGPDFPTAKEVRRRGWL